MNVSLKFLVLLVVMFPLIFVASCGDDEEDVDREPLIIGTWTLTSQDVVNVKASAGGISDLPIPESIVNSFVDTLTIVPENSKFTFNQNRTYTVEVPQQTTNLSGTWALSDDQSTITIAGFEAAEALLGSSDLVFVIQNIDATNFSIITSVPEITFPNVSTFGTIQASGDYQLNLEK